MKSRFYGLNDEQCSVEELALQYYASEEGGGWQGVHRQAKLEGSVAIMQCMQRVQDCSFGPPVAFADLHLSSWLFWKLCLFKGRRFHSQPWHHVFVPLAARAASGPPCSGCCCGMCCSCTFPTSSARRFRCRRNALHSSRLEGLGHFLHFWGAGA